MNRILSFFLAFIIAFVFVLLSDNIISKSNQHEIIISRVLDGDTFKDQEGRTYRLANINAPEKDSPLSNLSKDYLENFIDKKLKFTSLGEDKYNRILVRLYDGDNYLNYELVAQGKSSKFLVHEGEEKLFAKAEKNAQSKGLGIWSHSPYYGCLNSEIFPDDELVEVSSNCGEMNLTNWYLKDESRAIFYLSGEYSHFYISSGRGQNKENLIYLGSSSPIWNNDRDTLYLFDNLDRLVYAKDYGY